MALLAPKDGTAQAGVPGAHLCGNLTTLVISAASRSRYPQSTHSAGNPFVVRRLLHRHFLKAARRKRDVGAALRFVQLLPRENSDARTYNMLVSVCAAARDAAAALRVADMWRSTGRKVDTMLYTNIIVGAAPPCSPPSLCPL